MCFVVTIGVYLSCVVGLFGFRAWGVKSTASSFKLCYTGNPSSGDIVEARKLELVVCCCSCWVL